MRVPDERDNRNGKHDLGDCTGEQIVWIGQAVKGMDLLSVAKYVEYRRADAAYIYNGRHFYGGDDYIVKTWFGQGEIIAIGDGEKYTSVYSCDSAGLCKSYMMYNEGVYVSYSERFECLPITKKIHDDYSALLSSFEVSYQSQISVKVKKWLQTIR